MTAASSPNHGERRGGVLPTIIVLHYTGMPSYAEARAKLCDPVAEVSCHWLISQTGEAEALVPEDRRAWHAGVGEWRGITDVNSHSIGIELANTGDQPFPEPQMAALERLLSALMSRWPIPSHNVIAHSDMAPTRKRDPGPRFDWRRLALQGLSVWPEQNRADPAELWDRLRRFGYPMAPQSDLLTAFRLHFRPTASGLPDRVDAGLAADLARRFPVDADRKPA